MPPFGATTIGTEVTGVQVDAGLAVAGHPRVGLGGVERAGSVLIAQAAAVPGQPVASNMAIGSR